MRISTAEQNAILRTMAREAHESAIEAHGHPVPVALAWEFITQANPDYDAWIGKEMPRVFAAQYAAWGRDWICRKPGATCKELDDAFRATQSGVSTVKASEVLNV